MSSSNVVGLRKDGSPGIHASSGAMALCLLTLSILAFVCAVAPALAGFQEGRAAYQAEDYEAALEEFRPVAENGHAESQYYLGTMYRRGQGVRRDFAEAARWYRKAGEQGHVQAQYWLGVMLHRGQGVKKDFAEALGWHRKAAEQDHTGAQHWLARMYQHGEGTDRDFGEAARWYRKAAEKGHAVAQNDLGYLYYIGKGVGGEDDSEARRWFLKAAEQGEAMSQRNVGILLVEGRGGPQDLVEGYKWLSIYVAKRAKEEGAWLLHEVEQIMTYTDIAEAKERAKKWRPKRAR